MGPCVSEREKATPRSSWHLQPLGSHGAGAGAALPELSGCCGKNLVNRRKGLNPLAVLLGFV